MSPPTARLSLRAAWRLLGTDPVGLLGPPMALLATEIVLATSLWSSWRASALDPVDVALALALRAAVAGPVRAWTLTRAVALRGRAPRVLPSRVLSVLVTELATDVVTLAAAAAPLLLGRRWVELALVTANPLGAAVIGGLLVAAAAASALLARALLAWAPVLVVADGRAAVPALWGSARRLAHVPAAAWILAVSGGARVVGATACVAGALPFWAWGALALVVHHDPEVR